MDSRNNSPAQALPESKFRYQKLPLQTHTVPAMITHEEISKKAREIWEREGRPYFIRLLAEQLERER